MFALGVFAVEPQAAASLIAEFEIEITVDENENPLTNIAEPIFVGDVFRVTVTMEEFPMLLSAQFSLSFNPDVVEMVDSFGYWIDSVEGFPAASGFFYQGQAFEEGFWNGRIRAETWRFPFLNQEDGTFGVCLESRNPQEGNTLEGKQTVFWVYFRAIAVGGTEIRVNQAAILHHFDRTNLLRPGRTDFNHISPPIHVTPLRIRTSDGENIRRISQLGDRREVYAELYDDTVPVGSKLILAVFDNGRFYDLRISFSNQTEPIELPNGINRQTAMIRAFLWNDSNDMEPKFAPLVLRW